MGRCLAIGDIHGCFTALDALLDQIKPRNDDVLVTLGDYVNRGPDSRKVIAKLLELEREGRLIPLRGNHEIMMLDSTLGKREHRRWLQVGGKETLKSYSQGNGYEASVDDIPAAHWEFLRDRLLPYHETSTHLFVHANASPDMPMKDQPDYMLFWEKFNDPPRHESGKILVCGHTSQKSGTPRSNGNAICLDTWAFGGGWLSCLDVATGQIWQANEKGKTRRIHLEEAAL
jgi:serine/threonine protein phosphatase 1